MEDEIVSLGACIGAALVGKKVFTATSGSGYSLMQEHIGMEILYKNLDDIVIYEEYELDDAEVIIFRLSRKTT